MNMLATTDSQPLDPAAADRKVVLMRLLARAEATRLGFEPSDEEVKAIARWWRTRYELRTLERFAAWLKFSGMDLARFMAMMRDFAALSKVLAHYEAAIDDAMDNHHAIHTVHDFISRKDER
jgi:hypothetical protein